MTKPGRKNGFRANIETRIRMRNSHNTKNGNPPGYIEEALDYYLSGIPMEEIAKLYSVTQRNLYGCVAKAALYRLMVLHTKDRIDQLDEII